MKTGLMFCLKGKHHDKFAPSRRGLKIFRSHKESPKKVETLGQSAAECANNLDFLLEHSITVELIFTSLDFLTQIQTNPI
jgi:hypothetical protein